MSHEVPDYPIMNLDAAEHGLKLHENCDDKCEPKGYFTQLIPTLRKSGRCTNLRGTWNIWSR
ncbi:hypothetical protein [Nocardia crassostreae]|uniref:hypothetical protein n=1 Tax=Nocardia crassostreae TaxID=53428 RepID=UPI000833312A|nr:hypothetical protein [Nocardia crassostreae]